MTPLSDLHISLAIILYILEHAGVEFPTVLTNYLRQKAASKTHKNTFIIQTIASTRLREFIVFKLLIIIKAFRQDLVGLCTPLQQVIFNLVQHRGRTAQNKRPLFVFVL